MYVLLTLKWESKEMKNFTKERIVFNLEAERIAS